MAFNKFILIIIGLALTGSAAWSQFHANNFISQIVQRLDDVGYDLQLRARLVKPKDKNSAIVIVDIDDKSLTEQGHWPWPRNKIADLINKIQNLGAVVVALDITFPEPEPNIASLVFAKLPPALINPNPSLLQKTIQQFNYDEILANSFQHIDTVLGMTFHDIINATAGLPPQPVMTLDQNDAEKLTLINMTSYTNNIPILSEAAKGAGFINSFADNDGIIRHAPLLLRYKNGIYPALGLEAARVFLLSDIKLNLVKEENFIAVETIQLGKQLIPTDIAGRILIPFHGPAGSFTYFSATDILNNKAPANALLNKLVFIGTSAFGLGDLQATAVGSGYPGVEVHANIAESILNNRFLYEPTWLAGSELVLTLIIGILFTLLFPFLTPRWLILLGLTIPALLMTANDILLKETSIVFSVTLPILLTISLSIVNMAIGYLLESRSRDQLKNIFGQYIPPAYIEELLKHSAKNSLAGEAREMTVLFSDIRSFTSLAEKMSASEIKAILNSFFTPMTKIIFDCGGTIDKYVGDMIIAFWGAPLADAAHANHAITAALAMQAKVRELNPNFIARGLPPLKIGIGINTGVMNVGDMGSEFRRAYTVIGDAVNLASRLEALTKYYDVDIIVGEATQANQTEFIFRQLDCVKVKGKEVAVTIYEPLCARQNFTPALQKELALYNQALEHYSNKEWDKAGRLFQLLVESYTRSRLYSIYLERCLNPDKTAIENIFFMEK